MDHPASRAEHEAMMMRGDHRSPRAVRDERADPFADPGVFEACHSDRPLTEEAGVGLSRPTPLYDEPLRSYRRYCDRPTGWGTRLSGIVGTVSICGLVLATLLFTWKTVYHPAPPASQSLVAVELRPPSAPPEPVRDVAPGPEQVEKSEAEPEHAPEPVPIPLVGMPMPGVLPRAARAPGEMADPGPVVPETTAPRSIAAPAASRLSNDVRPDWEALILAHLERFRRYPSRARAARKQGTVYIRFTMNRAGMVLSSAIVKKSGSFELDRAALDTLDRAQPLPALPDDRPDIVELTVPVVFHLRARP